MADDRVQREQDFHDNLFSNDSEDRSKTWKYYAIMERADNDFHDLIANHCQGKHLLEYGCGIGRDSLEWLKMGAILTGIDISNEGIKLAQEHIAQTTYDANFYVMNAEETDFEDNRFDIVIGTAIIHHLDLRKTYAELARILNSDGHAIFFEPLGHNPIINLYRRLTPTMRTEDEHPLTTQDIALAKDYFKEVNSKYYYLFALLAVPFRETFFFNPLLHFLTWIDNTIMSLLPFMKKYAWYMILDLHRPKQNKTLA